MVKNFGPDAKPRAVRIDQEMPFDEAKLGKAMYIEYYLPPDPPGQGTNSPEYNKLQAGFVGRRAGQDVRFDADGNVWLTDRGYPHRLVKLDRVPEHRKTTCCRIRRTASTKSTSIRPA